MDSVSSFAVFKVAVSSLFNSRVSSLVVFGFGADFAFRNISKGLNVLVWPLTLAGAAEVEGFSSDIDDLSGLLTLSVICGTGVGFALYTDDTLACLKGKQCTIFSGKSKGLVLINAVE